MLLTMRRKGLNILSSNVFCNLCGIQSNHRLASKNSIKQKWEGVVGLEVHAQINSKSKLFSGSSAAFGDPVNSNVSLFDAAVPGSLPVLNKYCVEAGVLTALSLNCCINSVSLFDRKHYFYPDLPAGYQITQQRSPLAKGGHLMFQVIQPGTSKPPYPKISRIKQLQLEQDSGKSIHDHHLNRSLIDLNRAGVPLMEIVFEPDLSDGEEAASLVKELILILNKINTCNCKMEEGGLRVDANISIRERGSSDLGTRTEVKNIGSVRGVAKAIAYEIERQIGIVESGGCVVNETRAWDAESSTTLPMRDKEVKQDYRFMPEPNLPPLRIKTSASGEGDICVEEIKKRLPELPHAIREKLIEKYKLSTYHAARLVDEESLLNLFFEILSEKSDRSPKIVANTLINELMMQVNKHNLNLNDISLSASAFGEIVDLIQGGKINILTVAEVIEAVLMKGEQSPGKLVEEKNWSQITDEEQLTSLCQKTLDDNPKAVAQYKKGKTKVLRFFLGQVAKVTENRANMERVSRILKELLAK